MFLGMDILRWYFLRRAERSVTLGLLKNCWASETSLGRSLNLGAKVSLPGVTGALSTLAHFDSLPP